MEIGEAFGMCEGSQKACPYRRLEGGGGGGVVAPLLAQSRSTDGHGLVDAKG